MQLLPEVRILGEARTYDASSGLGLRRASHRLARYGHVGLSNAYDLNLVDEAFRQIQEDGVFPVPHYREVGIESSAHSGLELADDGGLGSLRAAILTRTAELGHGITSTKGPELEPVDQIVYLSPEGRSSRHRVSENNGPQVAFTVLRGEVNLTFGENREKPPLRGSDHYSVMPGVVVLFDRSKAAPFRYVRETSENQPKPTPWPLGYLLTQHPRSRVF
jgi:hypothetical protein